MGESGDGLDRYAERPLRCKTALLKEPRPLRCKTKPKPEKNRSVFLLSAQRSFFFFLSRATASVNSSAVVLYAIIFYGLASARPQKDNRCHHSRTTVFKNMNTLLEQTTDFVKEKLQGAEGGHDWFHIERVYKNALLIAKTESCDLNVVALGALLHDIADSKFHGGDETIGPRTARQFLESQNVAEDTIVHVIHIIENISFKGGNFEKKFSSKELDIVQDADRLDAIGAIGIARCFNYGGFKNRELYNPSIPPQMNMDKETYKASTSPTINHFYEKLLLLKDKMNTATGKQIAAERHEYMEGFLAQFYAEWNGEK